MHYGSPGPTAPHRWRACASAPPPEGLPATEQALQQIWHDQAFAHRTLQTMEGQCLEVHAPGHWNQAEGPDFLGAELSLHGRRIRGDVEIHFGASDWRHHGHHRDGRYEGVVLHVICEGATTPPHTRTRQGRPIPHFNLYRHLPADGPAARNLHPQPGACIPHTLPRQGQALRRYLALAGESRLLERARQRERAIAIQGPEAVLYQELAYGFGLHRHGTAFREGALALPYGRARQLAIEHPLLLEAALFQISGRLDRGPSSLRRTQLQAHRDRALPGLRSLAKSIGVTGVRPLSHPDRRLGGLAQVISATAGPGLFSTFLEAWERPEKELRNRRAFEPLFPRAVGHWSHHVHLGSSALHRPAAVVGEGLRRSIVGNVFVPFAIAWARAAGRPALERRALALFRCLPQEPLNARVRAMLDRVARPGHGLSLNFQIQQGLLHMDGNWCGANPTCEGCGLLRHFQGEDAP